MDRRNRDKMPKPGMIWSEKYLLWMDPDTRTQEDKFRHDLIAAEVEGDERLKENRAMRKITGIQVLLGGVVVLIVLLIVIPVALVGTAKPYAIPAKQFENLGPWTDLGAVSTGRGGGHVYKRVDPENGAIIYVMIGGERGGIFVLPAEKAK